MDWKTYIIDVNDEKIHFDPNDLVVKECDEPPVTGSLKEGLFYFSNSDMELGNKSGVSGPLYKIHYPTDERLIERLGEIVTPLSGGNQEIPKALKFKKICLYLDELFYEVDEISLEDNEYLEEVWINEGEGELKFNPFKLKLFVLHTSRLEKLHLPSPRHVEAIRCPASTYIVDIERFLNENVNITMDSDF